MSIEGLAALCLGACLKHSLGYENFAKKDRHLAHVYIFNKAMEKMPFDFAEKELNNSMIRPAKIAYRIQLIHALSATFMSSYAQNPAFTTYIDRLFLGILNIQCHPLLKSAVLQSLSFNLPTTNLNRLRIDDCYKPVIRLLSNDTNLGRFTSEYLNESIATFWLVWYPLPSDLDISQRKIPSTSGLCLRKSQMLVSSGSENLEKVTYQIGDKSLIEKSGIFDFLAEVKEKIDNLSYDKLQISADVRYAEETNIHVDLEPRSIYFGSGIQLSKFYIRNKSKVSITNFSMQVNDARYFYVAPCSGSLAPLESMQIMVHFRPRSNAAGEIKGYLRIRSPCGFPVERLLNRVIQDIAYGIPNASS